MVFATPTLTTSMSTTASTNVDIWGGWNVDYVGFTNAVTRTSTDTIWTIWTNSTTATTNAITTETLQGAALRAEARRLNVAEWELEPRPLTPEEVQRRAQAETTRRMEEIRRKQRNKVALEAKQAAEARAETLLQSCLTPLQAETLKTRGFFYVCAKDGNVYRIKRGYAGNVERVDPKNFDTALERFCAHPDSDVPAADAMLAQKLALELNPDAFLKVANRTRLYA
jgi:hypothetical protein